MTTSKLTPRGVCYFLSLAIGQPLDSAVEFWLDDYEFVYEQACFWRNTQPPNESRQYRAVEAGIERLAPCLGRN